jgi:hypothetical protein
MWYNENSDFFYKYIHGDKETFHLAFRKLNQRYTMIPWPVILISGVMYQHDIEGGLIFQHRNGPKWNYLSDNPNIPGFRLGNDCIGYLNKLRTLWDGYVYKDFSHAPIVVKEQVEKLVSRSYNYNRIGYGGRHISFCINGTIGAGKAAMEQFWDIYEDSGKIFLEISSDKSKTCVLELQSNNTWKGRWIHYEKMPIELTPVE